MSNPTNSSSTRRFSNRVSDYLHYRPHYPDAIIDVLAESCGLKPDHMIADIGSGTGFSAEPFLNYGNEVYGIEPNLEMREAGEEYLAEFSRFHSVDGTAENTTLAAGSVDFVIAGQAFHWFDREKARAEFMRVLRPGGYVALIWNDRRLDSSPFLRAYEELLLTCGTDYETVRHNGITTIDSDVLAHFFRPCGFTARIIPDYVQQFDFDGVKGRLLSSSYTPGPEEPGFAPMLARLREIFDEHQTEGTIAFEYDTMIYFGRLS
ncbi:MAG: methyltransferase [Chlorobi bacterium]|nr:methyltransferase [Chlorobiota bacterium]